MDSLNLLSGLSCSCSDEGNKKRNSLHIAPFNGKKKEVTVETIAAHLLANDSRQFQWGVYTQRGLAKHSGILLRFNDTIFTIDFGSSKGNCNALHQAFTDDTTPVVSTLKYWQHDLRKWKTGPAIQIFDLEDVGEKAQASAVLTTLCKSDTTKYHTKHSNCRHHVKRCLARVSKIREQISLSFLIPIETVTSAVDSLILGQDPPEAIQSLYIDSEDSTELELMT